MKKAEILGNIPIFSPEDEKTIEETTLMTSNHLQGIAMSKGVVQALAEAIGMMFAVGHFFKTMGLDSFFKQMLRELRKKYGK